MAHMTHETPHLFRSASKMFSLNAYCLQPNFSQVCAKYNGEKGKSVLPTQVACCAVCAKSVIASVDAKSFLKALWLFNASILIMHKMGAKPQAGYVLLIIKVLSAAVVKRSLLQHSSSCQHDIKNIV